MPEIYCSYSELVPIGEVKPNPRNPNKHPDSQIELLAKIINTNGWRAPITVSTRSGFVVRGHGRLMAAKRLGLDSVPVDYQDYESDEQELQDLLADNRIAELAEMDDETLGELLQELEDAGADLELAGFEDEMIGDIEEEAETEEPETPFTDVLNEEHNYIVLYFDNEIDWMQAQTLFDIHPVKAFSTRMDGSENKKTIKRGIGRVMKGAVAIENLRKHSELS